jgi:vacuolar-type H+-ATPase subunit H
MDLGKETEIMNLLAALEELLDEGKSTFLSSKVSINREEALEYIQDIRLKLPTELQQAVWIVEERNKILAQAQTEAGLVLEEAQETLQEMVNQHEITKYAQDQAQYIMESVRKDAREVYLGSIEYANERMKEVELRLKGTLDVIHKEVSNFEAFVTDILRTLYDHRQQLKEISMNPNENNREG